MALHHQQAGYLQRDATTQSEEKGESEKVRVKRFWSESAQSGTCTVEDKTACERGTKQTARQEQGGAWEHAAPGIKGLR